MRRSPQVRLPDADAFALAEALALDNPARERNGLTAVDYDGKSVRKMLIEAQDAISAAGGGDLSVNVLMAYRATGLWAQDEHGRFRWQDAPFGAHRAAAAGGLSHDEFAAMPVKTAGEATKLVRLLRLRKLAWPGSRTTLELPLRYILGSRSEQVSRPTARERKRQLPTTLTCQRKAAHRCPGCGQPTSRYRWCDACLCTGMNAKGRRCGKQAGHCEFHPQLCAPLLPVTLEDIAAPLARTQWRRRARLSRGP
jgi:hypothetical protein